MLTYAFCQVLRYPREMEEFREGWVQPFTAEESAHVADEVAREMRKGEEILAEFGEDWRNVSGTDTDANVCGHVC